MLHIDETVGYACVEGETMQYADSYFDKYSRYADTKMGWMLNTFRSTLVADYARSVLDIGIGDGAFLRAFTGVGYGYDVCPKAIGWLKETSRWADPFERFPDVDAVSFFDSIEHIPNPLPLLSRIPVGTFVVFSLPICPDIRQVETWKHYRPVGEGGGVEHVHMWERRGFEHFLSRVGLDLIDVLDTETKLGRQDVLTFVTHKD